MYFGNINETAHLPSFLKEALEETLPTALDMSIDGRTDVSDKIFVLSFDVATMDVNQARYEIHDDYIDIQLVKEGVEMFGVSNDCLEFTDDQLEEKDVAFGTVSNESFLTLRKGDFAVFFPGEPHKPLCTPINAAEGNRVKKAVIKIKVPECN
ncbi:YhcH/YjgK/YiaL family protein [Vibrio sp. DNB22_10_4]